MARHQKRPDHQARRSLVLSQLRNRRSVGPRPPGRGRDDRRLARLHQRDAWCNELCQPYLFALQHREIAAAEDTADTQTTMTGLCTAISADENDRGRGLDKDWLSPEDKSGQGGFYGC